MVLKVQVDIFNIFHDGSFTKFIKCKEDVDFTIDIQYLAEMFNSKYTLLSGKFKHCSLLEFVEWGNEHEIINDL